VAVESIDVLCRSSEVPHLRDQTTVDRLTFFLEMVVQRKTLESLCCCFVVAIGVVMQHMLHHKPGHLFVGAARVPGEFGRRHHCI